MIRFAAHARRMRRRSFLGLACMLNGGSFLLLALATRSSSYARLEVALPCVLALTLGLLLYTRSFQLPTKELLRLAQARSGLLTLSDIATTLDIEPRIALRTLRKLQRLGLVSPRWSEPHRNLWEFHDYVQLPMLGPPAASSCLEDALESSARPDPIANRQTA